jgi:hypothetical protein
VGELAEREWGPEWNLNEDRRRTVVLWTVVAVPAGIIAVLVWRLWGGPMGLLLAAVPWAAIVVRAYFWPPFGLRRVLSLRRLSNKESARAHNVAHGLASDLRMRPPSLYVISKGAPNALVFFDPAPALALSERLLESFARTELEAVVAHCLIRLRDTAVRRAMVAVWLGRRAHRLAPDVGLVDDVRTCALTRYPPALASALQKLEPRDPRFGPLWLVGAAAPHRSVDVRVADILDL